jgi:hypothetical protein
LSYDHPISGHLYHQGDQFGEEIGGTRETDGEIRNTKFWSKIPKRRDHMGHNDVERRIILNCALKKYGIKCT